MTAFTELLAGLTRDNDAWHVGVSDDWLQGRTLYGGLAAALCAEAALREWPHLPPLRSAQFAFVGPASGPLRLRASLLRKGKSTVFVGVDLAGDAGLATRATLCFGAARVSAHAHHAIGTPDLKAPEACPDFFHRAPPSLQFVQHFEGRLAGGSLPFSAGTQPEMSVWLRHRGPAATAAAVALLALADAPPPAASTLSAAPAPISTMTWSVDMLTDRIDTDDGWWLIRNVAEQISDGYSSQAMTLWNRSGRPIMAGRQNIAVFG